jgi:GxxExxY protein
MVGPLVKTTGHKSCLRFLSAQKHSNLSREELSASIAPEYQAIGHLDEWLYSAKLDKQGIKYEREKPFKIEFKGATISGRMDFVLEDGTIVEKKATTSANVYKRVFEQGIPESSHVAQLVSYLAFLKQPVGKLVVSYYEVAHDMMSYQIVAEKEFTVTTVDDSRIMLGQETYPHSVRDLARWYTLAEQNLSQDLTTGTLSQKPCQPGKYESPCTFCPLQKVCEESNSGTTLAEYIESAIPALLDKADPKPFKIAINTLRRQANRKKKNGLQDDQP